MRQEEKKDSRLGIVVYEIGGQLYGIPIENVVEVALLPPSFQEKNGTDESSWDGELLYRKKKIGVINLAKRFGVFTRPKYAIIVNDGQENWGILTHTITEILSQLPQSKKVSHRLPWITEVYQLEGTLVLVMDIFHLKRGFIQNEEKDSNFDRG
ncbi:MAG: chemotaxis protein CheW [Planctomycetota bacterium]|nr:MAG: chemotaxis protein CheW [Planctomycetota bacterium]